MANEIELLKKYSSATTAQKITTDSFTVRKVNDEQQVVYGEVYAPQIIDSHGHAMDAENITLCAHRFMAEQLNSKIDIMHNNKPALAVAVESFIARPGDPDFTDGAWVLAVKVYDGELWKEIKSGKYNGYSVEFLVSRETRLVKVITQEHLFGFTEENDGHYHAYYVKMSEDGLVIKGTTSEDDGHSHEISLSTATEFASDHAHRFFLS